MTSPPLFAIITILNDDKRERDREMTYEIMGKNLEDYALSLVDLGYPDCDMDTPVFLEAAALIKEGKITEAVEFANKMDTDVKEYILCDILGKY